MFESAHGKVYARIIGVKEWMGFQEAALDVLVASRCGTRRLRDVPLSRHFARERLHQEDPRLLQGRRVQPGRDPQAVGHEGRAEKRRRPRATGEGGERGARQAGRRRPAVRVRQHLDRRLRQHAGRMRGRDAPGRRRDRQCGLRRDSGDRQPIRGMELDVAWALGPAEAPAICRDARRLGHRAACAVSARARPSTNG